MDRILTVVILMTDVTICQIHAFALETYITQFMEVKNQLNNEQYLKHCKNVVVNRKTFQFGNGASHKNETNVNLATLQEFLN